MGTDRVSYKAVEQELLQVIWCGVEGGGGANWPQVWLCGLLRELSGMPQQPEEEAEEGPGEAGGALWEHCQNARHGFPPALLPSFLSSLCLWATRQVKEARGKEVRLVL